MTEIIPVVLNIKLVMLSVPILVSQINMFELESQDTPQNLSVGNSSRSEFTFYGNKLPGIVLLRCLSYSK